MLLLKDNTEYVLTEESKKLLGQVLETSINEIYFFDKETLVFTYVNKGARDNLGFSMEELSSLTPLSIKPEFTSEQFRSLITPLMCGYAEHVVFQTVHKRKNGSTYPVGVHLQLMEVNEKKLFVAICVDLSEMESAETRLQNVINGASLGYWDWSYQTGDHYVNDRWLEILGLERSDIKGDVSDWSDRIHPDDKSRTMDLIEEHILKNQSYVVEFRMRHKTGHWVWIQGSGAVIECDSDSNEPLRLCGTHQDISRRKTNEHQLRKLSAAVEQSPNSIFITNARGKIEYINPKFTEINGFVLDEVKGKTPRIISSGETPPETYRELWSSILAGKEWRGVLLNRHKSGRLYWAQDYIAPIRDDNGEITNFITIQEDVTEEFRVNEQLNYQATHDLLTGLINRHEFERRLDQLISSCSRDKSEHCFLFMDLDQFKVVNDNCGHVAGDEMLRQISSLMHEHMRKTDTLARLGGDEFAILMENCDVEHAYHAANELRKEIEDFRFNWIDKTFRSGVSIGLVSINEITDDSTEVMKKADMACYAAKEGGRNRVNVYKEDDVELARREGEIHWVSKLETALEEDLFQLYVQPIVPVLNPDLPRYYEVLIRLKDTDEKLYMPGAFLPAAERYNLSVRIDRWVIDSLFNWISTHQPELQNNGRFTINLSGSSLGDETLLGFLIQTFEKGFVLPHMIKFEITETAAISNLSNARVFIKSLKAHGCTFALDDFGSGLSSFAYLKNLPVDTLKIDGVFVKDIADDPIDRAMVKSINEIGHVLGMETIAEFVENEEIMDQLKQIGVNYAQGYGIAKPTPLETYHFRKR